jgi:hypothetical protein
VKIELNLPRNFGPAVAGMHCGTGVSPTISPVDQGLDAPATEARPPCHDEMDIFL